MRERGTFLDMRMWPLDMEEVVCDVAGARMTRIDMK